MLQSAVITCALALRTHIPLVSLVRQNLHACKCDCGWSPMCTVEWQARACKLLNDAFLLALFEPVAKHDCPTTCYTLQ